MEPGEAHLWYVDPLTVRDPALLDSYRELLTPEELAEVARIRPWNGRHNALVARGMIRTLLSRCCPGVPPAAWRFSRGRYGRPEIGAPDGYGTVRFNISHTDGLIACLLVRDVDCGVDVESMTRDADVEILVPSTLTAREAAALAAVAPRDRTGRFFRYWTLKEAYAKARGLGLQLPFEQFGFELPETAGGGTGITARFGPELADRPENWQFGQWTVTGGHVLAVALRRPAGGELRIVHHKGLPDGLPDGLPVA
ncbi:4'-phosphopantetheinyl transferase superfamily protein [Streptomyces sp. YIM 98790]|uniref:4'-phosphopantetheinyl transferase family protein n=1 Tax=Streptomyces sp. YIM 98790 TaxID=2689077 RepID=UPI0014080098|nr:4'-phosphopantetheinyl transferase superfamily protein [Streptomyces sp. YIM 98790]